MSRELKALAWIERGDLQTAESLLRELLEENPHQAVTAANLGAVLQLQGRHQESLQWLQNAIQGDPRFAAAHYNLAAAHQRLGQRLLAITHYREALRLDPAHHQAHSSLGNLYRETGRLREALLHLDAALRLQPDCAEVHNNLGALCQQKNLHHAALIAFRKALEQRPDFPEARLNLGHSLHQSGQLQEAIDTYQSALDQQIGASAELRFSLSKLQLLNGDYTRGWELYESRLSITGIHKALHAEPPGERWDGQPLPPGTPLLLVSEQGLGDTLQFMRYALALRSQGFSVSLAAPQRLHSLIQASGLDAAPLTPQQADQAGPGFWTPLLSVPRHLNVSPDHPLITAPHLKARPETVAKWRSILAREQRPVIGIHWQGSPGHEGTDLSGRSFPLEQFARLSRATGGSFLALQKGPGSEQLADCSFKERFVRCQARINDTWDFEETAAIVAQCDLVITNCTAAAHLAAGTGQQTWLLLTQIPEWRWGMQGECSFWYPSMRLFRQTERGNWDEVMERVAEELQRLELQPHTPDRPDGAQNAQPQPPTLGSPIPTNSLGRRPSAQGQAPRGAGMEAGSMQISQIFISDADAALPRPLLDSSETVKQCLPGYSYQRYNLAMLREFIGSHYDGDVLQAMDSLRPYSYKADLAKYCLAWQLGGWYVDISIRFIKALNPIPEGIEMVYFHDLGDGLIPNRLGYSVQASLFYTRPRNPIFEKAIRLVVDHCRSGYSGVAPICPTGPGVLGRAIAAEGRKANHISGDFMPLTPFHPNKNRSYVLPDGEIIARHKNAWHPSSRPAELTSLGAQGTNDYARMYRRGEIYGPPLHPIQPLVEP